MRFRIGSRIVKTAIGSGLSMYIAHLIGLNFYGSAGIITILCIETSKRRSLMTAVKRGSAGLLGLLCGSVYFQISGYHPLAFSIFIFLFLPLLIKIGLKDGFITSVVILLHIYSLGRVDASILWNECLLILIGTSVALILNSVMPNLNKDLTRYQAIIESHFKKILFEYARYIEAGDQGWNGKELAELEEVFNRAKSTAIRQVENHLLRKEDRHYLYFQMREEQYRLLQRMLPIIARLDEHVPQRSMFASFLKDLSESVKEANTAYVFIQKLHQIRGEMKELPLPRTRGEFETRASLHHLMNEINRYLKIKQNATTKWLKLDEQKERRWFRKRQSSH